MSLSSNLVVGDTNGLLSEHAGADVFVRDRDTDGNGILDEAADVATMRVSVRSDGGQAHGVLGGNRYPVISENGRVVAFSSDAPDLVPGDTNGAPDIFVHDLDSGETTRVSVASDGTQANGASRQSASSADGRFVAFESEASNLVAGDTNELPDIFVHDRVTGETTRVSVSSEGAQTDEWTWGPPSISGDGRLVVFYSKASALVPGDTNGWHDVFLHDRATATTTRVSVGPNGEQFDGAISEPAISSDGEIVGFTTLLPLVPHDGNGTRDVYAKNLATGGLELVSVSSMGVVGNRTSGFYDVTPRTVLSADGRFVVFKSFASNLVADTGPPHGQVEAFGVFSYSGIYVRDRLRGETWRADVDSLGTPGIRSYFGTFGGAISADGRHVAFETAAVLDVGDVNGTFDVLVRSRGRGFCLPDQPCRFDR